MRAVAEIAPVETAESVGFETVSTSMDIVMTVTTVAPALGPDALAVYGLLAEAVRVISFVNAPIFTSVDVRHDGFYVTLDVFERDSGDPTVIQLRDNLPSRLESSEHAVEWIYQRVKDSWVHELNEALHVNGARRRDLHDEVGRTIPPPS